MCGRFAQKLPSHLLLDLFKTMPLRANVKPSWNVAPTDTVMVVRATAGEAGTRTMTREADLMKWGLVPSWSKTGKMEFPTINAKSETAATSAVFRNAFKSRRCVVPADAFYEWQKLGGPKAAKQPWAVARADGQPLSLAGLWEGWKNAEGQWLRSFTILTTTPNEAMAAIHTRMPVILDMKDVPLWLGEVDGDHASLLKPCPATWLRMWKVSAAVGSVKNNDESLFEPV